MALWPSFVYQLEAHLHCTAPSGLSPHPHRVYERRNCLGLPPFPAGDGEGNASLEFTIPSKNRLGSRGGRLELKLVIRPSLSVSERRRGTEESSDPPGKTRPL